MSLAVMKSQVGGQNRFPPRSNLSVTGHLTRHGRKAKTFASELILFKQEQKCVAIVFLFINSDL